MRGVSMGEENLALPHVLLVSFPGQGHVNPLLRLAKRLAAKGLLVTFSSTDMIGRRIASAAKNSVDHGDGVPVGRGHLRFEFYPDGWEPDDPRLHDLDALLPHLHDVGVPALVDMIRRFADAGRPVSCIVNNPFIPWVLDVANDMGIPAAVLWVQSCAVFSTYYHFHYSLAEFPSEAHPDVSVTLPGIPTLRPEDLPSFLLPSNPYKSLTDAILQQFQKISKATWVLANTFEELESDAIKAISELSPLIPVGPLVEADDGEESQKAIKGDMFEAADCMEWLDAQDPLSVVYMSVGSVVVLSREEMEEMACGLKNIGRPFIWVVRNDCRNLLPENFVEETKERGMVVGWSPQDRVLTHRSVACFVTHCGWNSTLEALTSGVPVVAYPQWGDQLPDAKFLVDVYRVGVRLWAPAKREDLERCVQNVMTGPEAEGMRKRAVVWREAARKALTDGGSSDRNIQAFVDEIRRRAGA
ncbi:gallate 1-beta-glucosyltransferase-like [Phoenix dactylifera]|uniref:Glycosyltransferase n=1 Tax=Phoenix dactylifera TaxID=42345 RepID=A0A8B7CTD3_PHODC|nr:gallate 1-beta-glucosyltransferase-like [Phoenix dactylifera]